MKFKINGCQWEIVEKSQKEIKEIVNSRENNEEEDVDTVSSRYYGLTLCDLDIIYLDKDLPVDRKKKTLIHELTHCYINSYITHEDKNYTEETVCDIVANSYGIIKEIINKYFGGLKW